MFGLRKRSRASIPTPDPGNVFLAVDSDGLLVFKKEDGSVVAPETLVSELTATVATKQDAATAATDTELAAAVSTVTAAIAAEEAGRKAADNTEKAAREGADAALTTAAAAAQATADAALPKTGGTMTGALTLAGDPTTNLQPATRQYVTAQIAALVNSAPAALDTLKEISDRLELDESAEATLIATVATKLAKAANLSDVASPATALANLGGAATTALTAEEARAKAAEAGKADLEGGVLKAAQVPAYVDTSKLKALGEVTGSTDLDLSVGNFFACKLKGATTFKVKNAPAGPKLARLFVEGGAFAFSVEGIAWVGSEPTFTPGQKYLVELLLYEGNVYGVVGTQGKEGLAGANGSTVRNGTGAPAAELGAVGDFYIDTTASKIYGPKTGEGWGAGVSLVGPKGEAGKEGPEGKAGGFDAVRKLLLPTEIATFKATGEAGTEKLNAVAESPYFNRGTAAQTALVLSSGIPLGIAIPVDANQVVSGVAFPIKAEEATPANRTHLWVALLNAAGEVVAVSADYTSSAFTKLGESTWRALKFTAAYKNGASPAVVYAFICEAMSSTNPVTLNGVTLNGTMTSQAPRLVATGPASTTPESFTGKPALGSTGVAPVLALI